MHEHNLHEHNPLNDPELERLERRLSRATWPPRPAQRERWLYACGQAAGRAEMRRRLRRITAVAAVLACTSATLLAALVVHEKSPPVAAIDSKPGPTPQSMALFAPSPEVATHRSHTSAGDPHRPLSVVAGFEELTLAEVPTKVHAPREQSPRPPVEPFLTASGPPPIDL